MARRRASTGGADDYPEHLNPFHDGDDEDAEFEGAPLRRTGTLGRLRRRASLASTWSLRTLRRLAPQPPASHRASAPAHGLTPPPPPAAAAASPPSGARRRLRLPDLPWLSPRRRPRASSAPPAAPVISTTPRWPPTPSPTLSPSSPPFEGVFVLTPRTHRYRASPATPPEERARREALRLYGTPRPSATRDDAGEGEAGEVPCGPLAPLRIDEDPEQLRRAEMAAKQAAQPPAGRPPPVPRAPPRKRRAPLPPGPPPPSTPQPPTKSSPPSTPAVVSAQPPLTPPRSPFTEDEDDDGECIEGGRPSAEDSSPEADQAECPATSPTPPPSSPSSASSQSSPPSPTSPTPSTPTATSVPDSPRVPPRKPRRASAALTTPPPSPLPSPPPSPLALPLSSA